MKNIMQRGLLLLCLFVLLLAFMLTSAWATDRKHLADTGGTCGENLTWSFDSASGTLEIFGTGPMDTYTSSGSAPWSSHQYSIKNVVIHPGVTSIGSFAFCNLEYLESVSIPMGVDTIGYYAFGCCYKLFQIDIPKSVSDLGGNAFINSGLKEIKLPEGFKTIADYTFSDCRSLKTVSLPSSLESIGSNAFSACFALEYIEIPDGVLHIGKQAFMNCLALKSIALPNSITDIGYAAFENCREMISAHLPESITSIPGNLFCSCPRLQEVNIPAGVQTIGDYAFRYCEELEQINLPAGLTDIGTGAFYQCEKAESVTIPSGVQILNNSTFYNCASLKEVNLPKGMTKIGNSAFYGCVSLEQIDLPEEMTTIGESAFKKCSGLREVILGSKLKTIGISAFQDCSSIECIVLPSTVETLEESAFNNCSSMTMLTLNEGLKTIGVSVFSQCSSLKHVDIPKSVKIVPERAFYRCTGLESVTIAEGISAINKEAFVGCSSLKSVYLPNTVTTLGSGAFASCHALTDLTLSTGLETIPMSCFDKCDRLEYAVIPEGIKSIGERAFYHCDKLRAVYIPGTLDYIMYDAFGGCVSMGHVLYGGSEAQWNQITSYDMRILGQVTRHTAATPEQILWKAGEIGNYLHCDICNEEVEIEIGCLHERVDVRDAVATSCTKNGFSGDTWCIDCNTMLQPGYVVPAPGHDYYYENTGEYHQATCWDCEANITEAHSYSSGRCVCGAVEIIDPILVESITISHSLNLASDISINYVIPASQLSYNSFYLEVQQPTYNGNTFIGFKTVYIDPVLKGNYYYFTLSDINAVNMNDELIATLHMMNGQQEYVSMPDHYSIVTYAINQLNKDGAPDGLKTLCADLLRYGAAAQSFKKYRTDAPATAAMTIENMAWLSDMDEVTFGNTNTVCNDLTNPTITWAGKALNLGSKVVVKFIFNAGNYTGDVDRLTLHITYCDNSGATRKLTLSDPMLYNEASGQYAFEYDGLMAAELRTVISVAVYSGDTQLSPTLQYSADTYGKNKTGALGDLCKALFTYSDSAKSYFAG